jgi:hypothetical protein
MPKPECKDWTGDLTRDPDYKARRNHRFWLAENKRMYEIRLVWFRERTAERCEQYWTEFEACTRERTEEWMQQKLIEWSVEDSELEKLREEAIEGIACSFRVWLIDYWCKHQVVCSGIPDGVFVSEAVSQWEFQHREGIEARVKKYLGPWTERRQEIWMEELEEMDKTKSLCKAEGRWHTALKKKEFRDVSLGMMKEKARAIRASCMGSREFETIAMRIWRYIHRWNDEQAGKRQKIRDHLELYEDVKDHRLEQSKELALGELLEAGGEERMNKFKELAMLQSIEEEGCSHEEYRIYHVWWLAATKGVQFTRSDLEWEDEECRWWSCWVNLEDPRRWTMEEIADRTPGGHIPSTLRQD